MADSRSELEVEVVASDRFIWSGGARLVKARTADGDIGIMPGHTPVLALLAEGEVAIEPVTGSRVRVQVSQGFFSVDHDRVVIVADDATVTDGAEAGTR
ncbi:F0F1 ATP synthase subunit epsilon [Tersicoccus sp. Bi-70]|uniref:F0F1 ATP synthase subunit epsilon n=1 Tax=Tersicoccus sp. Bi-70 TaxID=1897634 RepID=UPI0009780676|nr:F0F1 ATP synthase subunit epsilon [Tersicoccus sp. Bi-70]OMH36644.1 ATP synthase F1 subunit epsilon [Tersicoccus sp. Bi-70]